MFMSDQASKAVAEFNDLLCFTLCTILHECMDVVDTVNLAIACSLCSVVSFIECSSRSVLVNKVVALGRQSAGGFT